MKQNPLSRLLVLFRRIPLRRATSNPAAVGPRTTDLTRLEELLNFHSAADEPIPTDFRAGPDPRGTGRWPAFEDATILSRTSGRAATLVGPLSIIPPASPAVASGRAGSWPGSTFRSRKEARRLRVVDRAIAEIAGGRRPR